MCMTIARLPVSPALHSAIGVFSTVERDQTFETKTNILASTPTGRNRGLPNEVKTKLLGPDLRNIIRLSYVDNARVAIDLRRTSNLQNIQQRMQGFSRVRFTWKIVTSSGDRAEAFSDDTETDTKPSRSTARPTFRL